ncbi:hypothetical protein BGX23_004281 [Mortierella sp. AD031]|nr:hypothetical protein BGX23_004281 [Mortierella sp. AD031]
MSRMIRTVSAISASTTPLASSPPSGATTPDASSSHVSDPFNRIGSALSSPWMKPSVCDDDHMNKLVSFQL